MITNLLPTSFCERQYIADILERLRDLHDYHLVATHQDRSGQAELPRQNGRPLVVLITSGETYPTPRCLLLAHRVWSCYVREETDKLRALPLGPVWDVPELPLVPPALRHWDVFFSGQARRREWLPEFQQPLRKAGIRADLSLSPSFRQGLPPLEYARRLADSRIVLCPAGVAPETFRHYEALRAGCAVLSHQLPNNSLYAGSPIRQLRAWDAESVIAQVRELLADREQEHERARAWWLQKFSPGAVATGIRDVLLGGRT